MIRKRALLVAVLSIASIAAVAVAQEKVVIQYDCIPNYANWGGVTALYKKLAGVTVPPDPKGSSVAMAALEKEKGAPQADTSYYSGAIGFQAAEKGLHEPYKPAGWEKIPAALKDSNGLWWTVHTSAIAFVVNTKALGGAPVPRSWQDLLKPVYKGKIAYDDPTWGGTSYTLIYGLNTLMGGNEKDFKPGLAYLKKLDANVSSYPRESIYNGVLRGEVPIWINADGNGYKMKYVDGGPVEVVIPSEGTFTMPLVMGLVKGAPHKAEAKKYLDWLLTAPAQGEFAKSYFLPVLPGATPKEIAAHFLPAGEYKRARALDLAKMAAAADALKRAWVDEIRGSGR
ncbi:MAG TPA: extracellular solute-binding protein [Thermoanaerobaculia bacterium]|jgi:putative spermidine/putrescine transport system substrate-binding protein|nr:extracellular solute-binding protein [Thermoanaerobaculia bacterium]